MAASHVWTESDLAIKKREDALRNARKPRSSIDDGDILETVPWGLQAEESPYDKDVHALFRGTVAKVQARSQVTVDDMHAALKSLPPPFDRPGFFQDPAAGKGFALCGGGALTMIQKDSSPASDLDLFWIGGSEFAVWKRAVQRVLDILFDMYTSKNIVLMRTQYCITAVCHARSVPTTSNESRTVTTAGPLIVQFVARSYGSIADVLVGFDIDACAIAYDGSETLKALPRAIRALRWQANLVDADRQSETFEQRLLKYAVKKGFDILVPTVDLSRITWHQLIHIDRDNKRQQHGLLALMRMSLIKASADLPSSNVSECGSGISLTNEKNPYRMSFPYNAFSFYQKVKYPLGIVAFGGACVRRNRNSYLQMESDFEYPYRPPSKENLAQRVFEPLQSISTEDVLPELTTLVEGHCGCFRPSSGDWFEGCC